MLSYRHSYHAGMFADVFKHAILVLLLQALLKKDKPFLYLDTHAGAGLYRLDDPKTQKIAEYRDGALRLWEHNTMIPEIDLYQRMLHTFNPDNQLTIYPGSPAIAEYFLRPIDRMVCLERHTSDYAILAEHFARTKNVKVYHEDAYAMLKSFLPPPERRGLVFLDPSYEIAGEYETVVATIAAGWKRWPTGIYALWYPILDAFTVKRMTALFAHTKIPGLHVTLTVRDVTGARGIKGSGMWIINPPWQLDEDLKRLLPWLWELLSPQKVGGWEVFSP